MIRETKLVGWFKTVLWAVVISGLVAGAGRFVFGLGASTNMLDTLPWGWWKIFNMVAGAALATSGFVVAAIIYILQWDRYRSVARLSVLVGFLGYGSSLTALLFDIGLPHRGWHPFFIWNPHSFLFEVFWCVSIYWGVTALELLPIITERLPFPKFTHTVHEKILPVVVLGITLSTMHHSSLGSLFMTSPTRLHPLWHSYWIPPEFFISAMGAGLSTIVLLMLAVSHLYQRPRDQKALEGLAKGSAIFLGIYLVIKIIDFSINQKWSFVFGPDLSWESAVFWAEISLQALLPLVFLSFARFRKNEITLTIGAASAFLGLIMHRVDTGIVGYFRTSEAIYIPNISEFLVSFAVLSAAGLVFFFLVERFFVLEEPKAHASAHGGGDAHARPAVLLSRDEILTVLKGSGVRRVLIIFFIMVPLTWISLRDQATGAFKPILSPVEADIHRLTDQPEVFRIDADQNGMYTDFTHEEHQQDLAKLYSVTKEKTCIKCHHLGMPRQEKPVACRVCHRDMEVPSEFFNRDKHKEHIEKTEDFEKLAQVDLVDRKAVFSACMECHKDDMSGLRNYQDRGLGWTAPGFKDAMHGNCLTCHRMREWMLEQHQPQDPESTGNCLFCHRQWADAGMFENR